MLIRDGVIVGVGQNLTIPADATLVKGDSLYVYAGFIDGLSRVALNKPREETSKERQKDPGNPAPEAAGITPYVDVRAWLNPYEKSIEEWRALGFTVGQVVPYGGMLSGRAGIVYYNGEASEKMVTEPVFRTLFRAYSGGADVPGYDSRCTGQMERTLSAGRLCEVIYRRVRRKQERCRRARFRSYSRGILSGDR